MPNNSFPLTFINGLIKGGVVGSSELGDCEYLSRRPPLRIFLRFWSAYQGTQHVFNAQKKKKGIDGKITMKFGQYSG